MNLALVEVRRRPRRFAVATAMLALIAVLLLIVSALLDGLFLGNTGAIRAQPADLVVFSRDGRLSLVRSEITPAQREAVEAVDGVALTGGLGVSLVGVRVPGEDDIADGAVFGYQLPSEDLPSPPPPGQAYADRRLERDGLVVGQTVEVGPARVPLEIVGWVDDVSYLGQGTLWVEPGTWRDVQNRSWPDAPVADGAFDALVVRADRGVDLPGLADSIDAATSGATETVGRGDATLAVPGVRQQNNVFSSIIFTTFVIAGVVVALFFVLLTLERLTLYGTLKAVGVPLGRLMSGLALQAVVVAVAGFVIGWVLTRLVALTLPDDIPVEFVAARALYVGFGLVVTAAAGSAMSFRRIARIEPTAAVGRAG